MLRFDLRKGDGSFDSLAPFKVLAVMSIPMTGSDGRACLGVSKERLGWRAPAASQ
jgi:hypothetical protein